MQAQAQGLPPDKYLSDCSITPAIVGAGKSYPGKAGIVPSNKLALPAGKAVYAPGELIYLSGRVLDQNCVPISDALVEIWQTNPYGSYTVASPGARVNAKPVFSGTGRAVTDNLGRYNFVTLFPGPYDNRAPHIHVKVSHVHFKTLDTEIFFQQDTRNNSDPKLARLRGGVRTDLLAQVEQRHPARPEEGLNARFDITLKGKNKYRRF